MRFAELGDWLRQVNFERDCFARAHTTDSGTVLSVLKAFYCVNAFEGPLGVLWTLR